MRVDWRAWADRLRNGDPTDAPAHIRRLIRDDQPVPREDLVIAEQQVRTAIRNKLLVPRTAMSAVLFVVSLWLAVTGGGPIWWLVFSMGGLACVGLLELRWGRQAERWATHYLTES